jgi:ABC-2 type transport system ATP-binding protein
LAAGQAQVCAEIDTVLATHRMLVGPKRSLASIESSISVVKSTSTSSQLRIVARLDGPVLDPTWEISELGLEDIIVAYMDHDDLRATTLREVAS